MESLKNSHAGLFRPDVVDGKVLIALDDNIAAVIPVEALYHFAERFGVIVPFPEMSAFVN